MQASMHRNCSSLLRRKLRCSSHTTRAQLFSQRLASTLSTVYGKHSLSSVSVSSDYDFHRDEESQEDSIHRNDSRPEPSSCPHCGQSHPTDLPPPLPQPKYSVHKRVLPDQLTALSSRQGRRYFMQAMELGMAESYWALSEHFSNQSDPAYCGVTTLLVVLNAMSVDPNVRWRGGWRYYGNEDVLLSRCCLDRERIRRAGITVEEFALLAKCQGVQATLKRPDNESEEDFRKDVVKMVSQQDDLGMLVVSFSRSALGQTGEGHFSPIAAYHEETDKVLLLDVARFKYAPYWVSLSLLYKAMEPLDETTRQSRGWFLLHPPAISKEEKRRPAECVPRANDQDICPVGKIKVEYCAAKHH